MRIVAMLALSISLAACGLTSTPRAVDVSKLGPMSGREQALMATAQAAEGRGEFASAERNYREAAGLSQGHVEAHLALAELYKKQNETSKARAVLEEAARFQPNHVAVQYALGKIYLSEQRGQDALNAFDRGLVTQPQSLDLLSGKGIALDMLRRHSAAQTIYLRALGLNPAADVSAVRSNLAMSYLLDNQPEKAAELLKEDVAAPVASPVTRHNLALAYGMLGRHTEARELVAGEMTEEEREAALKKLAQYIAGYDATGKKLSDASAPVPVREATN